MAVTNERVREILGRAECNGARLVIHDRLDRAEYQAVNKILTNLGGSWSRRDKAHLFDHNPSSELRRVVEDGWMPKPARTSEGYVRTPRELADQIIRDHLDDAEEMDELGEPMLCEPSAGDGMIVQALLDAYPKASVLAVEPNRERSRPIEDMPVGLTRAELEDVAEQHAGTQHAVVMNPPFSTVTNSTLWIDHVFLAWRMLRPGGRLVSIAPAGYTFRTDRRHRAVRALIEDHGGGHQELPAGTFPEAKDIHTVVIWADKPLEPEPKPKKRGKPTDEEKQQRRDDDAELRTEANARLDDEEYVARMERRVGDLSPDCRLATYSPRNQALVFMQALEKDIEVTGHLNTFKGWAEQGRMVQAGQSALRIVAAMGNEEEKADDQNDENEEQQTRKRFRMTTRFDLSQTKPIDEE